MNEPNIVLEGLSPGRIELVANAMREYNRVKFDECKTPSQTYYKMTRYWMRINGWIPSDNPYLFERGHIGELVNNKLIWDDVYFRRWMARGESLNDRLRSEFLMFRDTLHVYLRDHPSVTEENIKKEVYYLACLHVSKFPFIVVNTFEHMPGWKDAVRPTEPCYVWRGTNKIINDIRCQIREIGL